MYIGTFGDVIFTVGHLKVLTPVNFAGSTGANWAKHDVTSGKARSEYISPKLKQYTFELLLSSAYGVNPKKMLNRFVEMAETGEVHYLIIGFSPVAQNRFKIVDISDEWDVVIDTNVKALLAMTRLVVPGMVERGRGHVINMGSIAGDYAYPGGSVYCACKAAVKALSDGLRIDLVDTPIRVTNVKPGLVETNFSVVRFRGNKAAADNVYEGLRPLTGDDVAEVVYFAASLPEHIQIAEVLVMPTNQATGTIAYRKK